MSVYVCVCVCVWGGGTLKMPSRSTLTNVSVLNFGVKKNKNKTKQTKKNLTMGTVDAQLKVLLFGEPIELLELFFGGWNRSDYSFTCFAYCRELSFLVVAFPVESTSFFFFKE